MKAYHLDTDGALKAISKIKAEYPLTEQECTWGDKFSQIQADEFRKTGHLLTSMHTEGHTVGFGLLNQIIMKGSELKTSRDPNNQLHPDDLYAVNTTSVDSETLVKRFGMEATNEQITDREHQRIMDFCIQEKREPLKYRQDWVDMVQKSVTKKKGEDVQSAINKLTDAQKSKISDGYHTFEELYGHRVTLHILICSTLAMHQTHVIWRSKTHSDGSSWPGWFLLGINTEPGEQITYHLPTAVWEKCGFAIDFTGFPPTFDGHTPADVLTRLNSLIDKQNAIT